MTEHSEELSRGPAHTDSEDDDDMSEKVTRKSRKKVGGIDLDEVEHTLRKAQHEREECVSAFVSLVFVYLCPTLPLCSFGISQGFLYGNDLKIIKEPVSIFFTLLNTKSLCLYFVLCLIFNF